VNSVADQAPEISAVIWGQEVAGWIVELGERVDIRLNDHKCFVSNAVNFFR
jgi:hypothetical protein